MAFHFVIGIVRKLASTFPREPRKGDAALLCDVDELGGKANACGFSNFHGAETLAPAPSVPISHLRLVEPPWPSCFFLENPRLFQGSRVPRPCQDSYGFRRSQPWARSMTRIPFNASKDWFHACTGKDVQPNNLYFSISSKRHIHPFILMTKEVSSITRSQRPRVGGVQTGHPLPFVGCGRFAISNRIPLPFLGCGRFATGNLVPLTNVSNASFALCQRPYSKPYPRGPWPARGACRCAAKPSPRFAFWNNFRLGHPRLHANSTPSENHRWPTNTGPCLHGSQESRRYGLVGRLASMHFVFPRNSNSNLLLIPRFPLQ